MIQPQDLRTYPALTGKRKQSVTDVKSLFGPGLVQFMERKGVP